MLRERASDAIGHGVHGNGTVVDVADTPRTDSIFVNDSQAAQVVSVVRGYLDALRRFRRAGSENSSHVASENRAAESR